MQIQIQVACHQGILSGTINCHCLYTSFLADSNQELRLVISSSLWWLLKSLRISASISKLLERFTDLCLLHSIVECKYNPIAQHPQTSDLQPFMILEHLVLSAANLYRPVIGLLGNVRQALALCEGKASYNASYIGLMQVCLSRKYTSVQCFFTTTAHVIQSKKTLHCIDPLLNAIEQF